MKPTILILLIALSLHSFSQSRFSKRKYRKGMFIEKITHIKQKKATGITSPPNIALACRATMEEKKAPANENVVSRYDTVIAADSHEHVDSASLAKHASKAYAGIIKHNTLKLSAADIYCLSSKPLVVKTDHGMLRQKLGTSSVVMQKLSDQSMTGGYFEELIEGLKRCLLICLLAMMVFALFASIMAIATYPVASGTWILGLALCIYATMGIIIAITSLTGRDGGKFMSVLKIVFLIISVGLLFTVAVG